MRTLLSTFILVSLLNAAGCTESEEEVTAFDPVGSKTDGFEGFADYDCRVILRATQPDFEVDADGKAVCEGYGCTLTVLFDARDSGGVVLEPMLAARNTEGWYAWDGEKVEADDVPEGYSRYRASVFFVPLYEIDEVPMVPFLQFSEYRGTSGRRYYDHNINPGPFDDYVASRANGWRVQDDPRWGEAVASACRP